MFECSIYSGSLYQVAKVIAIKTSWYTRICIRNFYEDEINMDLMDLVA